MSVIAAKRTESRYEVIIFSEKVYDLLIDLISRNFGIKDVDDFVRVQYAHGQIASEDFPYYRVLLRRRKENIEQQASLLTCNLRAAYYLYPTSMHEYENRRDLQNRAIINCEMLLKELQKVADKFQVDINLFKESIKAINREIELIKGWRQRDNKFKSHFTKA
ncbi:MAG: hypothetical protein LUE29_09905 [Lachnospiraceae bacterium]|nr:hypothetical protein [Lachnospiraceae bacterium]